MSSYREQSHHAKQVRRGVIDQRPVHGKAEKPKPEVVVEYQGGWMDVRWAKWGAYRDEATANIVIERLRRKYPFTFRIKP